jgi:nucleotide-binding universal stress UspA family protein
MAQDRDEPAWSSIGRVVVGVDGSGSSQSALRWALRQAQLTGGSVWAVIAWEIPLYYGMAPFAAVKGVDLPGMAKHVLAHAVSDAVSATGASVPVGQRVAQGDAAQVLIEAARGAALLVVGNRGHGGFTEALLGSVSQRCTARAACPVVVVRDQLVT